MVHWEKKEGPDMADVIVVFAVIMMSVFLLVLVFGGRSLR